MRCTSSADLSPGSRRGPAVLAACLGLVLLASLGCRRPPPEPPPDSEAAPVDSAEAGSSSATVEDSTAETVAGEPIVLPMEEGSEVPRHLAGGQVDEFRLDLEAGQFLHLVIEQRGVDVVSALSDPDDQLILQVDGPTADQDAEEILTVAEVSGGYRLRVEAWEASDSGDYTVRIDSLHEAGAIDRRRASANLVFYEAELLRGKGNESAAAAIEKYQEAVRRFRALGDRSGEGIALRGIGRVYHRLAGRDQAAVDVYLKAVPILRESGELCHEAPAVHQLGQIYLERGDAELALEPLERALDLWQRLGRRRGVAWSALDLGRTLQLLGRAQEALTYFETALAYWSEVGDTSEIASIVFQRGESLVLLGKYQEALDDFERALSIWRESGAYRWEIAALKSISKAYQRQGRLDLALTALNRAWDPLRHIDNSRSEALLWNSMGLLHQSAGRYGEARDAFERSLAGLRQVGDRAAQAVVLHNIGGLRLALDRPCESLDFYRRALRLFDAVLGSTSATYNQVTTLLRLAKAERRCHGSHEAQPYFEQALAMLEELRSRTESLDYRSSYLATQHWFYDEYVDLLMDLHRSQPSAGYDAEALAMSERARARSLLDSLVESEADLRLGADPTLIRRERELARQLQAIEQLSMSFEKATLADDRSFDEQLSNAQVKKRALLRRLVEVRAQIHRQSPRYQALAAPRTLEAEEIRTEVLDSETLLLEYDLGEERSYLWLVTPDTLASFELPAGSEIEGRARRTHELLKLSKRRRSAARTDLALAELGELLLGPVAKHLKGGRRLLVVAEGALEYIPFAALPLPGSGAPVLVGHEVVNMPSASALAVLREQLVERSIASGAVAVIADPVFQSHDPRVGAAGPLATPKTSSARSALVELPPIGHERLVYSQLEAQAILRNFADHQSKALLDFEATREAVLGGDLGNYRIVHFATHGVLDEEHPELSRLLLSLVDRDGNQRDNGRLFAHEIDNLDLPVELVVLSACETALGKEIRGEGLVGLTQSFFHAGAARVLVSLWNVDDYATAELMSRFYSYLSEEDERPSAALRRAQIDLWRQMRVPYYWAGFVIRGEWR